MEALLEAMSQVEWVFKERMDGFERELQKGTFINQFISFISCIATFKAFIFNTLKVLQE